MLTHIIIASLVCLGFNAATWDDMLFDRPAQWMQRNLPYWVNNPAWMCPICMASVWGTAYYWCFMRSLPLYEWPLLVLSVAGFNSIVIRFQNNG